MQATQIFYFAAGEMSGLKMIMPEHVLMNHDIHGECVAGNRWPRFMINKAYGCGSAVETQRRVVGQGLNKSFCEDFVVKNVTATCEYMCAFNKQMSTKTVIVTGL